MKAKNVKIGQLLTVKTEEEALKVKKAKLNEDGLVETKEGDLYLPDAEGEYAGEVHVVSGVDENGAVALKNCEFYIPAAFLRPATDEDVARCVDILQTELSKTFSELANENIPAANMLAMLTGQAPEKFVIEAMRTAANKLEGENHEA